MIRKVIIRPEAKLDLREAKTWYRIISAELRDDFVGRVDDAIALAKERPLAFQIVHRTFRRILLHRRMQAGPRPRLAKERQPVGIATS